MRVKFDSVSRSEWSAETWLIVKESLAAARDDADAFKALVSECAKHIIVEKTNEPPASTPEPSLEELTDCGLRAYRANERPVDRVSGLAAYPRRRSGTGCAGISELRAATR